MIISSVKNSRYNEDILIGGESLVSSPCVVWSMTVTSDTGGAGVVTIYDDTTIANPLFKVRLTAENPTVHLSFPKGRRFLNGVYAAANFSSADISLDYD